MKILLIYATNSSGTFQVTEIIRQGLEQAGHRVTVRHARDTKIGDLKKFPVVILGSCTWELFIDGKRFEGQLQEHMHALVHSTNGQTFPKTQFALFALGDRSYTEFCHAADLLEAFVHDVQGQSIGPTLRIDSWFFNINQNRANVQDWTTNLTQRLG